MSNVVNLRKRLINFSADNKFIRLFQPPLG